MSAFRDWSSLHHMVGDSIFNLLSMADMVRTRSVCGSWRTTAKHHIKTRLTSSSKSAFLFQPRDEDEENANEVLYSLDNNSFKIVNLPFESKCIGSSHAWLLVSENNETNLCLYNPLVEFKVHLPRFTSTIQNAIIFGSDYDPISGCNYGVMVIHGIYSKLAFVRCGDTRWSFLDQGYQGLHELYLDLTSCKERIYALSHDCSVEVWEFRSMNLVKMRNIPIQFPHIGERLRGKHTTKEYIIHSKGEILLARRCVREFIDLHALAPSDEENLDEENEENLDENNVDRPYLTQKFYVYRLDLHRQEWVQLENLGDRVIFVGGNESMSFPAEDLLGCQPNSIYFTDDYWHRIGMDGDFAGHDTGIFKMDDGSFAEIYQGFDLTSKSPAFWLLPKP